MNKDLLVPLLLDDWLETKTTLHLFTQIVGKIRLKLNPKMNHWWHAPLYVSARGLTTRAIPFEKGLFEMEFDFIEHKLKTRTSSGDTRECPLVGNSVSGFFHSVRNGLHEMGIDVKMITHPFDSSKVKSDIKFPEDNVHKVYDKKSAEKFWRILTVIEPIFREFRGRFTGKCSPIHFFWHSFDLAVTRFSGRPAKVAENADPVTKQAYSHEVISAGFWPGDDNIKEPAFYAYVAPEPPGLGKEPLSPQSAWWQKQNGSHMALFKYEDFRKAGNPKAELLDFLQSSYEAGAKLANWPMKDLEAV